MENETVEVQDEKQNATPASEEKQIVDSVPYARFKETVAEKNELKSQLDSINKQNKADSEATKLKQMEEKGEYEKIMSDMNQKLEGLQKKAIAWDDYQVNRRDSLLSKLPEDDREIYNGLSLDKLEVHVDKVITNPKPKQVDNSIPGTKMGYSSMEEWATTDPKSYQKANNPQTSGNIKIAYRNDG